MTYKVGQPVIIRRNLGTEKGRNKDQYYYGGTLRNVPLGAKAVIREVNLENDIIRLKFENTRYGDEGRWSVHPDELTTNEEQEEAEKQRQERFASLLEDKLSDKFEDGLRNWMEYEGVKPRIDFCETSINTAINNSGWFNRVLQYFGFCRPGKVETLLSQREPDKKQENRTNEKTYETSNRQNPFKYTFNVREEFAVWLRQEFPYLEPHKPDSSSYVSLLKRREEVCEAAKAACEHGVNTTDACVRSKFEGYLENLDSSISDASFTNEISSLVNWIEHVSMDLDNHGGHYGTRVVSERSRR
jgi:hypothetical protein